MHRSLSYAVVVVVLLLAPMARADASPPTPAAVKSMRVALAHDIGHVAERLETSLARDDVKAAERLYELERRATRLVVDAFDARYPTMADRAAGIEDARATLRRVLRLQERMLDHTLAELDRELPGEPTRQLWAREGVDLYRALLRSETPGQAAAESGMLARFQKDFADKGGSADRIHYLGPRTIERFRDGQLIEWVQLGNRIRVTDAGAKHPVIALRGSELGNPEATPRSVRGAGSARILRGANGKIASVIVSNSSGNYKPGIGSTVGMVQKLESAGVPTRDIILTSILPGEPVLVKLLLKSKKTYSKDQIKAHLVRVESKVARALAQARRAGGQSHASTSRVPASLRRRTPSRRPTLQRRHEARPRPPARASARAPRR